MLFEFLIFSIASITVCGEEVETKPIVLGVDGHIDFAHFVLGVAQEAQGEKLLINPATPISWRDRLYEWKTKEQLAKNDTDIEECRFNFEGEEMLQKVKFTSSKPPKFLTWQCSRNQCDIKGLNCFRVIDYRKIILIIGTLVVTVAIFASILISYVPDE